MTENADVAATVLDVLISEEIRGVETLCPKRQRHQVYRPIQYLGSKLRTIDFLVEATRHLVAPGDRVFDAFSGSSVVSQAFAQEGWSVTAIDASAACGHIANAMLGVGREPYEECSTHAHAIARERTELPIAELQKLVRAEREAALDPSGALLAQFSRELPQCWRLQGQARWLAQFECNVGDEAFGLMPLVATHYAGTYFGLEQALTIDRIRNSVERRKRLGEISEWTGHALMTALFSAMSRSVFSAGKHFAQPMIESRGRNDRFYLARLMSDRSISIEAAFEDAAASIDAAAASGAHAVITAPIEKVGDAMLEAKPALVYADPPYTAQQYSRFYHVLEVVSAYRRPSLQLVGGKVTRGIYSNERYSSPYSSKRLAASAFNQLIEQSRAAGASLAISYSLAEGESGNARMIGLEDLKNLCVRHYGRRVSERRLQHSYRQFNAARHSRSERSDPEVLLVCEA